MFRSLAELRLVSQYVAGAADAAPLSGVFPPHMVCLLSSILAGMTVTASATYVYADAAGSTVLFSCRLGGVSSLSPLSSHACEDGGGYRPLLLSACLVAP